MYPKWQFFALEQLKSSRGSRSSSADRRVAAAQTQNLG